MTGGHSPFHAGEREIQERVGMREKIEGYGRRGIRDHMPEQHRQFFERLEYFFVGSVDAHRRVWASVLTGAPGFIRAPSPTTLRVAAVPAAGDALRDSLREGAPIGGLGIELHTRRRNRVNGRVSLELGAPGFAIHVEQSFGNCPQYIQARRLRSPAQAAAGSPVRFEKSDRIPDAARALIGACDTFFVASHYAGDACDRGHGVDVSHRGGRPGILRAIDDRTLVWPEYRGNFFFNTLGNLARNPHCGLLMPGFNTGDTLQLTGHAEILWDMPPAVRSAPQPQRAVRFHVTEAVFAIGAITSAWEFLGHAPQFTSA